MDVAFDVYLTLDIPIMEFTHMPVATQKPSELPSGNSADRVPRHLGLVLVCWFAFSALACFAWVAPEITKKFQAIYAASVIDIPFLTQSFISGRYCWWLLAIAALALAIKATKDRQHPLGHQRRIAVAIGAVLAVWLCLIITAMIATYLPVFALGHHVR